MACVECGRRWDANPRTGRPRRYCSRSCQGRAYRRRRDAGRLNATGYAASTGRQPTSTLEAAVALADAHGIAAVTLRAVADRVEITLATAQRDLGSRDRLVSMMAQHILARHAARRPPDEDPVDTLTRLAEDEWRAYCTHPWLVGVMASTRPPLVPAVLEAAQAAIHVFTGMGLDDATALHRYLAFSAYIQGMGMLLTAEQQESGRSGTSFRGWWAAELRRLDRSGAALRHPWLSALSHAAPTDGFDPSEAFRHGLDRVIRGLTAPS